MPKALILGTGTWARTLLAVIAEDANWEEVRAFDEAPAAAAYAGWSLILAMDPTDAADARAEMAEKLAAAGWTISSYIHATADVAPTAVLDAGVCVLEKAIVGEFAHLSAGCVVSPQACIETAVEIGPFAFIGPSAVIGAEAHVGARAQIGANATVPRTMEIGEGATVAPGAVVYDDLPARAKASITRSRRLPVASDDIDIRLSVSHFQRNRTEEEIAEGIPKRPVT